jgi:hypothetical protein
MINFLTLAKGDPTEPDMNARATSPPLLWVTMFTAYA